MIKCVCVVSSRRNKTNPHHGINTFLFFKQLVYKHSSPNKHQLINHEESINKMCIEVIRAYVETFSTAFTSLPFVMFYYMRYENSFVMQTNIYMLIMKIDEAASNNFHSNTYI